MDRRTGICSFSKEERPTDLSRHKDSAGVATNNKRAKKKRARIPPFRCVAFALPRLARLRWSGFIDHRYKLSRLYLLFAFSSGPSHGSFMGPQNDREEKKNKWREHEKNFSCLIPEFFFLLWAPRGELAADQQPGTCGSAFIPIVKVESYQVFPLLRCFGKHQQRRRKWGRAVLGCVERERHRGREGKRVL